MTGALFCRAGCAGVESAGSARGKGWAGAEVRRDETEGVYFNIRVEEVDGGGFGAPSFGFEGVLSADLTVVLPLASDEAVEDARSLVGLRRSSGWRDLRDCVERAMRVEDSDGAAGGILCRPTVRIQVCRATQGNDL